MQFVIIGLDGNDEAAPARRSAVREEHIKMGDSLLAAGNLWYGAVLLHDDGSMKGSMYVVDFDSKEALQAWLDKEPYVVGGVWKEMVIHKSNTREPWQFSRREQWFKERQV